MIFLIFVFLVMTFIAAALIGIAGGLVIGIVRYVRNPMAFFGDFAAYFKKHPMKRYDR